MGTGSVANTKPIKNGTSPVPRPMSKSVNKPSSNATRIAVAMSIVRSALLCPARGGTKAFGAVGML